MKSLKLRSSTKIPEHFTFTHELTKHLYTCVKVSDDNYTVTWGDDNQSAYYKYKVLVSYILVKGIWIIKEIMPTKYTELPYKFTFELRADHDSSTYTMTDLGNGYHRLSSQGIGWEREVDHDDDFTLSCINDGSWYVVDVIEEDAPLEQTNAYLDINNLHLALNELPQTLNTLHAISLDVVRELFQDSYKDTEEIPVAVIQDVLTQAIEELLKTDSQKITVT